MHRADELLQKLWTKAVGTADYDKEQWKELQTFVNEVEVEGNDVVEVGYLGGSHQDRIFVKPEFLSLINDKIHNMLAYNKLKATPPDNCTLCGAESCEH